MPFCCILLLELLRVAPSWLALSPCPPSVPLTAPPAQMPSSWCSGSQEEAWVTSPWVVSWALSPAAPRSACGNGQARPGNFHAPTRPQPPTSLASFCSASRS